MTDVSVIMTVYNGENYLEQSIKSVIDQRNIDWELIIVNDGSTDGTYNILNKYTSYKNIKVINSKKIGRGNALNLAINNTNSNYIANLDSDDLFVPDKLSIQHRIMEDNKNISILCTNSILINENFSFYEYSSIEKKDKDLTPYLINKKLGLNNPVSHITVLMRKSSIFSVGCYDNSRQSQLDYDLWIRMASTGYLLYKIDIPLSFKRIHKGQNFERKKRFKYIMSSTKLQRRAIKLLSLPKKLYIFSLLRFLYGLSPSLVRMNFKRKIYNK